MSEWASIRRTRGPSRRSPTWTTGPSTISAPACGRSAWGRARPCSARETDASLYLLIEGSVDIVEAPDDGRPVATRRARTVIGELGLLLNVPRTATVVASTDAVCWELTQQTFYSAIERSEPWAARLALAIASELAGRFVDVSAELTRLDADGSGPAPKPAELAQLRTRLLAEWAF